MVDDVRGPRLQPGPTPAKRLDLDTLLDAGVVHGDALRPPAAAATRSVALFFTAPPYADQRGYARIHPDRYVEWFLPFAEAMYDGAEPTGSLVLNIKNRVANRGPLKGQRHPYVYQLVLALQHMGWRWVETYIWAKPNAVPGRFGPRTKDAFEYVYHFAARAEAALRPRRRTRALQGRRGRDRAAQARTRSDGATPRPASAATGPRPTCSAAPTRATS